MRWSFNQRINVKNESLLRQYFSEYTRDVLAPQRAEIARPSCNTRATPSIELF